MKGIRQPTLADQIVASNPRDTPIDTRWYEHKIDRLRMAKRFVLDPQAATYLGQMLRDNPRIVADAQDFAIKPFDLMWVEIPFPSFYLAITGRHSDADGDRTVGYLYDGPTVTVASCSHVKGKLMKPNVDGTYQAWFNPTNYTLHHPMSPEEQLRIAKLVSTTPLGLDLWFWGESADSFIGHKHYTTDEDVARLSEWERAGLRALRDSHGVDIAPMRKDYGYNFSVSPQGSGGDLRNIVAILLFLNRTQDLQVIREEGMMQRLINRKPRPLLPHRVITIRLNPLPRLATLVAGSGIRRRLHDVRGHFCHDKRARAGCQHGEHLLGDWGEWWTEYEVLRWECSECKGKRWWRHEHRRGHSEVGVIKEQVYAVTK